MRVAVIASASGAGKTTLGRRLAEVLGVPFIELDALFHGPGWTPNPDFEVRAAELAALPGWVIDGNYFGRGGDVPVAAADLVVWLDPPLAVCLWRLALRTGRRFVMREVLWNGNREHVVHALLAPEGLFRWAIAGHARRRREFPARLAGRNHVRLRTRRQEDALLAALASAARGGRPPGA